MNLSVTNMQMSYRGAITNKTFPVTGKKHAQIVKESNNQPFGEERKRHIHDSVDYRLSIFKKKW